MKYVIATALIIAAAPMAFAQNHRGMKMDGPVTRAQVEARVKERFAKVDTNRDGAFTKEEAEVARQSMVSEGRDRHFAEMDSNKDGSISRAEFDTAHQRREAADGGERHRGGKHGMMRGRPGQRFDREDANGDGKVTLAEALSHNLARFDSADANKDGTVTMEERRAKREAMRDQRRGNRVN